MKRKKLRHKIIALIPARQGSERIKNKNIVRLSKLPLIAHTILAAKKSAILEIGSSLIMAVVLLHFFGFLLGYLFSRTLKFAEHDAQTISIEVGMQNSGLATELARSNFTNYALATVPGAISALTHCVLGSIVAGLCRLRSANIK